jgi:hypothetical protein
MEYEFTLKYQLTENDCNFDDLVERLGAGGCDDALIGIGQPGRIGLKFTREAASAKNAIKSAIVDIRSVVPTAKLVEAGPGFVGLTGGNGGHDSTEPVQADGIERVISTARP